MLLPLNEKNFFFCCRFSFKLFRWKCFCEEIRKKEEKKGFLYKFCLKCILIFFPFNCRMVGVGLRSFNRSLSYWGNWGNFSEQFSSINLIAKTQLVRQKIIVWCLLQIFKIFSQYFWNFQKNLIKATLRGLIKPFSNQKPTDTRQLFIQIQSKSN